MTGFRSLTALAPGGDTPAGRAWLLTFCDLICLLLTFFVMLYAMRDPDPHRFRSLGPVVPAAVQPSGVGAEPPDAAFAIERLERGRVVDLDYLGRVVEAQIRRTPDLAAVRVQRRPEGLVLSLPADLLFDPGAAELSGEGAAVLGLLGRVAGTVGNALDVVGHADPTPAGSRWISNWELSLARAASVAALLRQAGYERDITLRGHGDGQAGPAADAAAMALARRVDLIVRAHGSGR